MSPTTAAAPGGHLGRYEILGALGTGGMGEVYRARDPGLEREVALKLLPAEIADQDHLNRFAREAKTLASLKHPNIVDIYSVEEAAGLTFLTMELVEGKTLAELIPRRGMRLEPFFDVAIPLADAVAAAHERGVIHRDLKPGNVMVDAEGSVKVLDFGLACRAAPRDLPLPEGEEPTASFTGEGVLVGTVPYMSPEQIQGEPVDVRSDLFSLGAVLYEMLTGERPFRGASTPELLSAILRDSPRPLTESRPELPRHLGRIVRRCLEKEPKARYQAARDVVNELTGLREELSSEELERSRGVSVQRRGRHPWRLPLAAGAALLALAVALPLANRERLPAGSAEITESPAPALAVLPLANASGRAAGDHLGIGMADSLIARFASVPGVTVLSRTALAELKGGEPPQVIARELGASHVLDGSLKLSDERLLVNLRLVDGTGALVRQWSQEDDPGNLFDLQSRLAAVVAEALGLTLSTAQRRRLSSSPAADLQAYLDYSRARAMLRGPDESGNLDSAFELLASAVQRDPSFGLAHATLGHAYWVRYQATSEPTWAERAEAAMERAAELSPEDPHVRIDLATMYRDRGRLDDAAAQLQAAVRQRADSDDAWRELAQTLYGLGRKGEAVEAAQRAVDIRPGYWRNYYRLGGLHLRGGALDAAIATYSQALALKPTDVDTLINLGAAFHAAGDTSKAFESFEAALAIAPNASLYNNIGTLHYKAGRFAAAAQACEKAVALDPDRPLFHRNLADAYQQLGREEQARAAYLRASAAAADVLATNPGDAATLSLQALCEAKVGHHEAATRHAEAAVEMAPFEPEVRFRAAVVHALGGQSAAALGDLELALRLGYSAENARTADEFVSLRSLPRYREILGEP
jgi:tetratricopeptide (TPR) repeat protein